MPAVVRLRRTLASRQANNAKQIISNASRKKARDAKSALEFAAANTAACFLRPVFFAGVFIRSMSRSTILYEP